MVSTQIDKEYKNKLKGTQCKVLIPYEQAKDMKFEDAIDLAMKQTDVDQYKGSGQEVYFNYNINDNKRTLNTPIILGTQCFVKVPNITEKVGSFHTHPKHSLCFFSTADIDGSIKSNEVEISLGCPNNNLILQVPLQNKKPTEIKAWEKQVDKEIQYQSSKNFMQLAMQGKTNLIEESNKLVKDYIIDQIKNFGGLAINWK